MTDRVHTCHADCPCQHGGEPRPDFLPAEGSLLAFYGVASAARLLEAQGQVEAAAALRDAASHPDRGSSSPGVPVRDDRPSGEKLCPTREDDRP